MFRMPGKSYRGPLPPLTAEEQEMVGRLRAHVTGLAGDIGARSVPLFTEGLRRAERLVEQGFVKIGLTPRRQTYEVEGETVANIEASLEGATRAAEIVLVGAHYDGFSSCPAANDNATGVAGLLEIARTLAGRGHPRTVRFVAFVNEEPPYFATARMGSAVYANRARANGDNIVAMLSLETIGCYSQEKGSQKYPLPFGWFYPDQGNFIGFVADLGSRGLVRRCIASFRDHTRFPSEGVAAPGWITGIDWSDHRSFWQAGYPAIMITDTAPFRYDHYHLPTDTPDRVDYESMARVVAGIARVVEALARE